VVPAVCETEVKLDGAPGSATHGARRTTITTSFDGALTPAVFFARARAKYVPALTLGIDRRLSVPAAEKVPRLFQPGADPSSMLYERALQTPRDPCQLNSIEVPLMTLANPVGCSGGQVKAWTAPAKPIFERLGLLVGLDAIGLTSSWDGSLIRPLVLYACTTM
jgi:hypothetical protein